MGKNSVQIKILNETYNLRGDCSEEQLCEVAKMVDQEMQKLQRHFPNLTLNKLAILTALNIADKYLTLKLEFDQYLENFGNDRS